MNKQSFQTNPSSTHTVSTNVICSLLMCLLEAFECLCMQGNICSMFLCARVA